MGTNGFIFLLLSTFTLAILITYLISHLSTTNPPLLLFHTHHLHGSSSSATKSWPELEFNWKLALATLIALLGSAFGTVGGVGGGGIFVPVLTLVVGFDSKSAAAISKCMIMGASASSVWYNMRVPHPTKVDTPIIDYDIALIFQPLLMLGITIGVTLSVVFPYWLVTLLIIILFVGTSTRSFVKGVDMWKAETLSMLEMEKQKRSHALYAEIEPLLHKVEMSRWQILSINLKWKRIVVMTLTWLSFLLLQIVKNDLVVCSKWYWVVFILQVPLGFVILGYKSIKLYREKKEQTIGWNTEQRGEPSVRWGQTQLAACALCGVVGGTVGGLLGSGGGFVLGPLLLEMGIIPQVASATATFVMMYSSSLSVVEFYLLKRFPVPHGAYLTGVAMVGGFWGQWGVRKVVEEIVKRGSVIVFILSAVIFSSAVLMGVVGIERSMRMMHDGDSLGFFDLCSASHS